MQFHALFILGHIQMNYENLVFRTTTTLLSAVSNMTVPTCFRYFKVVKQIIDSKTMQHILIESGKHNFPRTTTVHFSSLLFCFGF